jgi:hypothetical protein
VSCTVTDSVKLTPKFNVHVIVHHDKFLIIKPTRCTISHIYSWNETLHVLDSSSVHYQEFHPDPACKLS